MTLRRAVWILVMPPVLAALLAVFAWGVATTLASTADEAQTRLQAVLDRRPSEPSVQAAKLLLSGATVGLSSSALQSRILVLVQNADLQQIEARGAEAEGTLTRLRVNLRLSADEKGIMQTIIALEAAEPLIFVDALRVSELSEKRRFAMELDLSAYAGRVAQ